LCPSTSAGLVTVLNWGRGRSKSLTLSGIRPS